MTTTPAFITYTNANAIPTFVDFARDRQTAFTFNVREWEVGVRALRPLGWQREAEGMAAIRRVEGHPMTTTRCVDCGQKFDTEDDDARCPASNGTAYHRSGRDAEDDVRYGRNGEATR